MTNPTIDDAIVEQSLPPIGLDASLAFEHPKTVAALAYWRSKLDGRRMPSRADVDPRQMRGFMPNIALVELRHAPDGSRDYFIRLAGTAIDQVFGPLAGHLIGEFLPPEIELRWRRMLDAARDAGAPIRTIGRVAFQAKHWLECETLIAPLGFDGRMVSMFFVAVATWEAK